MATFELTGPDGGTYQIDAPDERAALSAFSSLHGQSQSSMPAAIADIPKEIGGAFRENLDALKVGTTGVMASEYARLSDPNMSLWDQAKSRFADQLKIPGAVAAIPGMIAAPITGAARSLLGHPLADMAPDDVAPFTLEKRYVSPDERYATAKQGVDLAMSAAAPRNASPAGLRTTPAPLPTSPELKAEGRAVYNDPSIKAINIPPRDVANLRATIENDLMQQGFRPTAGNAPATMAEVKNLSPGNGVLSVKVDDIRSARRALNIAAGQKDPLTGMATPDANAATQAISHIDQFLDGLAPSLKTANANYAAAKAADRLDYRLAKAERRAARSGTGGNLENTMRQEADKIPNRGLTSEEQALRDRIVMGTTARNALRTTGKLGVDGGLSLLLNSAAAVGSGGTTIPVTVGGTIARKVGERLTRSQMEQLSEMIRARSPMAKGAGPLAIPAPNAGLLSLLPAQFQQLIGPGLLATRNPAHADDNKKRRGR